MIIEGGPMDVSGKKEVIEISVKDIKLGKNSRLNVNQSELEGLMASIKEVGLLQPIGVVKNKTGYEVVYGNRRFLAVSKLGYSKILCVVHENKTVAENDIQNLTENLQRKNISLTEAGRYMSILSEQGLTQAEIAVRLGVSRSYVQSCFVAYSEIPEEYQDKIVVKNGVNDRKREPGKMSINVARDIVSAAKTARLTSKQRNMLFELAIKSDKFNEDSIPQYVTNIKANKPDPTKGVVDSTRCQVQMWVTAPERMRLYKKYIEDGPFNSFNSLCVAILKGEISEKVKCKL